MSVAIHDMEVTPVSLALERLIVDDLGFPAEPGRNGSAVHSVGGAAIGNRCAIPAFPTAPTTKRMENSKTKTRFPSFHRAILCPKEQTHPHVCSLR
jgi:hypothetical protein